ncbi:TonB-dependent receptor [Komagataeibacter oboediens]|uniref:TonB-dependent receptor n=1 Tax=Komagataeibacter oboediens TaxID=65958 RepID=UPI001C2BA76F|nr:TonB-dependent receptor [Komagataeibacter oboediens]MBV0890029.1 TonB-dependent receptor [Komagataeibacter oboediens]MBV1824568.1 TonB-dependent receptor [Komagataeibacter oboediens]MCK9820369.1 TonB-dependent receptor [Komagataeibacter oboediens]WEQ51134.1 TonB-dependent receptor [Komagataeibacter oboediens]
MCLDGKSLIGSYSSRLAAPLPRFSVQPASLRVFLAITTALALSAPRGAALARTVQTHSAHARPATAQHTDTAAQPQGVRATGGAEQIRVGASVVHSADGVTGRAPGGGLIQKQTAPKARSTVTPDYIMKQSPAQNAYNAVKLLPGIVVANTDPAGHEKSALSMRGLTQDQIANVWEGMPLSSIGGYNLDVAWVTDSENIGSVSVQPGSSNLDTPAINGSGGMFEFKTRDPSKKFGGLGDVGVGNRDYTRQFLRVDTGEWGKTGIRSYISFSNQHDTFYHGPGQEDFKHIDFKILKEWGDGNRVSLVGGFTRGIIGNEPYWDMTMASWKQKGLKNELSGSYDQNNADGGTDYWKLNWLHSKTFNIAAPSHFNFGRLALDVTPYVAANQKVYGSGFNLNDQVYYGYGGSPQSISIPNQLPGQSYGVTEQYSSLNEMRGGVNAKLSYKVGHHHIYLGYWFDYDNSTNLVGYTGVSSSGDPATSWGKASKSLRLANGQIFYSQNYSDISTVNGIYAGDTVTLLNGRLVLDGGMRVTMIHRDGTDNIPGLQRKVSANEFMPLPTLGGHFQLNKYVQIFGGVSTGAKAPPDSAMITTINPNTGQIANQGATHIHDEYNITEEVGVRYTGKYIIGSFTYFHYNLSHHQVSTSMFLGNEAIGQVIDAGNQTTNGFDAEIGTRPIHHFRPYASMQYLHSTIDNDIQGLPTKGKMAVNTPTWAASLGVDWDNGIFFWNYGLNYFSKQYSTFMNQEALPSLYTMNATVGARLPRNSLVGRGLSFLKSPEIMLWVNNMIDSHAYSAINSVSLTNTTIGKIQGTAPTYNTLGRFSAVVTFRAGF